MILKEKILSSIAPVIDCNPYVAINYNALKKLSQLLYNHPIPKWNNSLQLQTDNQKKTAQYYFFVDSINFCFWAKKGEERWAYKKGTQWISGYYAFAYAIKKAIQKNPLLLEASYLSTLPYEEFSQIFQGRHTLLLLKKRHEIVTENFAILQKYFDGQMGNILKLAKRDVNVFVDIILSYFPSFRDISLFNGKKVYLLKRPQIVISDIHYALNGKGIGAVKNMEDLTVFPDYKLPQLLEAEGVLLYSKELKEKITREELLEKDSKEEVAIRAYTIYACNEITSLLRKSGRHITNNQVDYLLWEWSQLRKFSRPHHKTVTTFY